nr:protein FAR1-RELATED SEQUENCE 5-like [Arachis hypogaea]
MHAKCMIKVNDEAGIRTNKTFLALANEVGGPSNLGFSEKDVRNYIPSRLRFTNVNANVKEMLNYFMRMKEINPNFFYAVNVDDDYKFGSAVWVDARCRASYEYYGDVVIFDTTYRTNQHDLPFASFVGVSHHGKSTLLGCALLGSEEVPSFEWVFTQWLKCMGTAPQGVITDQCRFNELNVELKHIIWNSLSVEAFEDGWAEFIDEFNLHHNKWLSDLFDDRRMWVPIFFKGQFWASMRSTQRSESMHSFFGGYLHCKTSLVQFVHEFDNVLRNKEQKELEDDAADSRGLIPCATSSSIEQQFQQEYTNDMFRDKVNKVPSCYVLHRWSKKIKCKRTYIKSSHDVRRSDESRNLFRGFYAHVYNVVQEFVDGDDEAAMLHAALDDARAKIVDYRTKLRYKVVVDAHTSIATKISSVVTTGDIQGPSKDNRVESCENIDLYAPARQIGPQGVGGFMSLLNSFGNT